MALVVSCKKSDDDPEPINIEAESILPYSEVSAGGSFILAIRTSGTLWSWGLNKNGQLGLGNWANRSEPQIVGNERNWVTVSAGEGYTLAVNADHYIYGWGMNIYGQLGDGTFSNSNEYPAPGKIHGQPVWIDVSAGSDHTLALRGDGTIWACGRNDYGQLGDSTKKHRSVLVQINVDNDWATVQGGKDFTIAVKTNGSLWSWGQNAEGRLGLGTIIPSCVIKPTQVGEDRDWTREKTGISAGLEHVIALKTDGTLWTWGGNPDGELGDGTFSSRSTPAQVGDDSDWAAVSAGYNHSLAIKKDGTLWAWGMNNCGQLGDRTYETKASPVKIGTDKDWAKVDAGTYFSAAIKTDGSLWVWGDNTLGQLGNGIRGVGQMVNLPILVGGE